MKKCITLLLILISFAIKAQEKDKFLLKGNEEFAEKKYADAEADYRVSQSKFKKKAVSSYNLGTSIYKQNQHSEAKYQFAKAIQVAKTKPEKHKAFHNLGNVLMKEKEYQGAVEAYKNALRNNPNDEETRYNYALAKKMLKDNPPSEKPKENKKDQDKDKKEENKNQDKENDKNKDKNKDKKEGKDNQDKDKGNQPQQPQPSGASKQRIDNLLDAVNNEEKKVQEKVNAQKALANPQKPEKDW